MNNIYKLREKSDENIIDNISSKLNVDKIIIDFLYKRGYKTLESINNFINFKENDLRKISKMNNSIQILERIKKAIINKENIIIYGDYDTDGICATTIFIKTLKILGANVNYFINNKYQEGYGISIEGINRLLTLYQDTNLIITCDNGIIASEAINYAKSKGLEVIVTDHHTALNDIKLDCLYICETTKDEDQLLREGFCGAELARRICVNLIYYFKKQNRLKAFIESLYVYSGLATVADVISLNQANHFVLKKSLEVINSSSLSFIKVLKDKLNIKTFTEYDYGFKIAPLFNAATRMTGEATFSLNFLLATTYLDELYYLDKLIALNEERKEIQNKYYEIAKLECEENKYNLDKIIILSNYQNIYYPESISGNIAAKITQEYHRPTIVLAKKENSNIYNGSGRSINGINILEATNKVNDLLIKFGGHKEAFGLTLYEENIEKLRNHLNTYFKNTIFEEKIIYIDYYHKIANLDYNNIELINKLAPFGKDFEKPIYATYGILDDKENTYFYQKLIKTKLYDNNFNLELLTFNIDKFNELNYYHKKVFITGIPTLNIFNNNITKQFIVEDILLLEKESNNEND